MSMRWDPLLAAAAARELSRLLVGARMKGLLFDRLGRIALLFLDRATLAFELHPTRGWLSILPPHAPLPGSYPLSGRLRGVESLPDESILLLESAGAKQGAKEGSLVVEWVGSRWNALWTEGEDRMIRSMVLPQEGGKRTLIPGTPYRPPTPTHRAGSAGPLDRSEWDRIAGDGQMPPAARRKAILHQIAWTSAQNVDGLLGLDGWERWKSWQDPEGWGGFLLKGAGAGQPYPVPVTVGEAEEAASLLEAIARARAESPDPLPLSAFLLPPDLRRGAEERLRRVERRAAALRRELEEGGDPAALRALGDLILARFREIPRGAQEVRLKGFSGEEVAVDLDPTLPPQGNAAKRYAEAARLERARRDLPQRIDRADGEADRWRRLLAEAIDGQGSPGALEAALGPEGPPAPKGSPPIRPALPYRRFLSSGGLEIRVGKGARQNDDLTFHHAEPEDIWLHALQVPGAHVILRWGREEGPPQADLLEAGILAALHSEARSSGSVPVAWTRRKHVRKPRKSPPGMVSPERVRTLMVEPDPEVMKRLRADQESS